MQDMNGVSATGRQLDIDQQIRRSRLTDYVMWFGGMNYRDAEKWLDGNCPAWRCGVEPKASKVEVSYDGDDDDS